VSCRQASRARPKLHPYQFNATDVTISGKTFHEKKYSVFPALHFGWWRSHCAYIPLHVYALLSISREWNLSSKSLRSRTAARY
jgi:hypothetical protein